MIERSHGRGGTIVVRCDGRSASTRFNTRCFNFKAAVTVMNGEGWKSRLIAGRGWLHFCPACAAAEIWLRPDEMVRPGIDVTLSASGRALSQGDAASAVPSSNESEDAHEA